MARDHRQIVDQRVGHNPFVQSVLGVRSPESTPHLRSGDILLAHLGIWSRRDPWAPAVLEPLIAGLKAKGLCFRTLRDHPRYGPLFQR